MAQITQTITREHLAKVLRHKYTNLTVKHTAVLVDCVLEALVDGLIRFEKVKIRLFGTFTCKFKDQRMGRNPKTLAEALISERFVVTFKASPTLNKMINLHNANYKQY